MRGKKPLNLHHLFFLLMFFLLLTAYGKEEEGRALPEKPKVIVHYWRHFWEPEKRQIDKLIQEFEAVHPNIKIEFDSPPYSTYTTKLAASVAAGTGPEVINIHNSWAYKYIKSGYIKPVPDEIVSTEEIEEQFFPLIKSFKYEGRFYGLPIGAGNLALFYNTKMFEEAGLDPEHPPTTWEELKDAAQKLTRRQNGASHPEDAQHPKGRILISGAAIGQPSHQGWNYLVEGLFRQAGSQIISPNHKNVLWNSPQGVQALGFFTSFIKDLKVYSYAFLSPYEAFSREKAAMMVEGNWSVGRLAIDAPDLPYRTAVLPKGKERATYGTFWANCVTKKATGEVETAAWEFIKFITSAESSREWALNVGELPMRKAIAEARELREKEPHIAPFLEQMPYAYSSLKKEEEVYKRAIIAAVEGVLLKDKAPEDALNDAAKKVNEMLGLGSFGARRAVPALIEALNDENVNVRARIIRALGELGDDRALAYLEKLRDDLTKTTSCKSTTVGKATEEAIPRIRANLRKALELRNQPAPLPSGSATEPMEKLTKQTVIWDMAELGRFDPTNKAYAIAAGRVMVDLRSKSSLCPTGLGHLASGRDPVREIVIRYEVLQPQECWLHITWDPGGSGKEQFELICNGTPAGKSDLVDATEAPYEDIQAAFKISHRMGKNELILRFLSGDGLQFKSLTLATTSAPPHKLRPDLKFPKLEAYAKAIGEPGTTIDSAHVRLFAPKRREREAREIMKYLVRAYDKLHKIVGVHTRYKIVVYHFPERSSHAWGGTSGCVIWYGYNNLALEKQDEWKRHRIPHVSGYIEEMAHNFVGATKANFGWEATGWSIGAKVSAMVAPNPVHTRHLLHTRRKQADTFRRYKARSHTFPPNLRPNLADRIHAHLLRQCEQQYGPTFWADFFAEVRKERKRLYDAVRFRDGDAIRNQRYRITVECFDRLPGLEFKKLLIENGISLEVAIESLHPTEPGWNRKFK